MRSSTALPSLVLGSLGVVWLAACSQGSDPPDPFAPARGEAPRLDAIEPLEGDALVDDFEDGDLTAWLPDGEGHYLSAGSADALTIAREGRDGDVSLRVEPAAERVTLALSAAGAPLRRHDYSSCDGIELVARHDGDPGALALAVTVTTSAGEGTATVELSEEWASLRVPFAALDAAGVGAADPAPEPAGGAAGAGGAPGGAAGGAGGSPAAPPALDLRQVLSFSFGLPSDASLLVDSITLTGCELLPLNPPLPEPPPLGEGAPEGSPVALHGQLRVRGTELVDQTGEPVQLKGVSSMWLNMEDDGYARSREGLRWLRDDWGLSVFRAAMGVEFTGGFPGYLDGSAGLMQQVQGIIDHAIELGVYVIVDFHSHQAQDYAAEARAFFAAIAERYGELPNVIYEPYNEPDREAWVTEIKPYHETVIATIRSIDPDNVIVAGTARWSQLPNEAAQAPIGASNLLYTAHFYACEHGPWLRDNVDAARAAGVGVFVTEWGATAADGGLDGGVCVPEAEAFLEWMETGSISWAAWKLDDEQDATSLLSAGVPTSGGWTDAQLHGHAPLVREWMRR